MLTLFISGCTKYTYIESEVKVNPLKAIATKAEADYTVTWIDDNTLEITDWWATHSIYASVFSGDVIVPFNGF